VELEFDSLAPGGNRKPVTVKGETGKQETLPLYTANDCVRGQVHLTPAAGKKVEHQGIKVELLGTIELFFDRGNTYDFVQMARDLEPAGEFSTTRTYKFEFNNVEMPYESYNGVNVRLKYMIRVTVLRPYNTSITQNFRFWVRNVQAPPEVNNPIKMEVGIEDCLHIEFEYSKSKYSLKDVVVGKIYFLLVRIKIKHMEVEIRRRESTGTGANTYNESETIAKYEIMDGAPVRGESIPIRLFLSPYDLTPTYRNINNKFSVKYFLNLVLVDEEDRRYFKQQEITCWRAE
jgi:vacuolar protein sorting-associated protein 26